MTKKPEKDEKLILLAKALKEEVEASDGLKEHIVKKVSNIAVSSSEKAPLLFYLISRPAIASVMVSAAILLIVCLPLFLQSDHKKSIFENGVINLQGSENKSLYEGVSLEPLKVDAKKNDGNVMLSWEGEEKNVYKVTRSTSPIDFSNAYTVMVAGNSWMDPLKNDSNIIYYKIE
jgi:hypothetical protein